jgi:hypothetical protein
MVGVAVCDNLPIANTGCAHLIFKRSNVVGRRERIARPGQDEYTGPDRAGQGGRFGRKDAVKAHHSLEICSIARQLEHNRTAEAESYRTELSSVDLRL